MRKLIACKFMLQISTDLCYLPIEVLPLCPYPLVLLTPRIEILLEIILLFYNIGRIQCPT